RRYGGDSLPGSRLDRHSFRRGAVTPSLASIDLNSDLGEGAGTDAELMPLISSANIACGAHAGDESTMRETVALARRYDVALYAPPKSAMVDAALDAGLRVVREGFVDRAYESDGTLRSRKLPGALHTNPQVAAKQALSFVRDGGVRAHDGSFLDLVVDTLCLHGDTPGAAAIAVAVRAALDEAGVKVRATVIWP